MKVNWILALAAVTIASLATTPVHAQSSQIYSVSDSVSADLAAFGGGDVGCGACEGKGGCDTCCGSSADAEPYRLFPEIGCGWNLTGWVALGATANGDDPLSRINGPVTFNDRTNFQANQLYMTFGRDVDTGGCGTDWGGRVDLMFGSDYIFTQAVGLETHDDGSRHWNRSGNQYGLAMPQLYGEIGYNNVSIKLGHFYTIIGYEVVTAPDNFFYSHSYTMQYGEPFTHTGALATWDYSDRLVLYGGVTNGWDKFDAETDVAHFLGGLSYTPTHERYSLTLALVYGDEDGATGITTQTRSMYSLVFNYHISDQLEYVFQHDNGWNNLDGTPVDEEWYGVNQYLFYTLNDCWKFGIRGEWFRDDDGTRLSAAPVRNGGLGPGGLNLLNPLNSSDFAGDYYNLSVGLNWTPTTNIFVRPELRWDWSEGTVVRPYDDLTKDSQFTAAFDAIWLF